MRRPHPVGDMTVRSTVRGLLSWQVERTERKEVDAVCGVTLFTTRRL